MTTCEICEEEEARYVCSDCGRKIGFLCFQREGWLCSLCPKREDTAPQEAGIPQFLTATTLLFVALIMVFAGAILLTISASATGEGSLIVVFPFFFASSSGPGVLLLPAIILTVLMVILAYLTFRKMTEE